MRIVWDQQGKRKYETGVQNGVVYPVDEDGLYSEGFPWTGLISVTESPSGAEPSPLYADNIKYLNLMSVEELGLSIEAYTYPDEFAECDGSAEVATGVTIGQQDRKEFGFCYKTLLGNDTDKTEHGYKLHLDYGCIASPSEKAYSTVNESPEGITFSWEVSTTPVPVPGYKPTSSITVDSTKVSTEKMKALEDILYGTDATTEPVAAAVKARLPLPEELIALVGTAG